MDVVNFVSGDTAFDLDVLGSSTFNIPMVSSPDDLIAISATPSVITPYVATKSFLFNGVDDAFTMGYQRDQSNRNLGFASSFSFWFKRTIADGVGRTVISKRDIGGFQGGFHIYFNPIDDQLVFRFVQHLPLSLFLEHQSDDNRFLVTGDWIHALVTYDGSNIAAGIKIYINGLVLPLDIKSDTTTVIKGNSTEMFSVGRQFEQAGTFSAYGGNIDNIAHINRVVTPSEATQMFALGVPPDLRLIFPDGGLALPNSNLIKYLIADEQQASNHPAITDSSVYKNHGHYTGISNFDTLIVNDAAA